MDSDEEETFIGIGKPVEQIDDDVPLKKPTQVQDLAVRDNKGRQRFHGAFTGGFSAGYFNTVGTKEGFAPSEFVSSRDKKFDGGQQRPEDFMDEEDFSEHGIAPRKLVTSDTFSTDERRKRRHDEGKAMMTGTVFEGTSALTDLIIPEKLTIGIRLLKKLGWKQGHGIGTRKKPVQTREPKEKVYGCSLPSQENEEESDEEISFGPKDENPISFVAKDNVRGLGYSGLDPRSALPGTHINLFEPPAVTKTGRKGIRGQAFGVGALEDADDDIYTADHMSNYDMTMEIEDTSNLHGWTAPRHKHESKHLPIGYVGKVLEGFKLSDKPLHQKKVFKPPDLPRHFRPVHVFQKPKDTDFDPKQSQQSAITRSLALGEVGSVFDLVSTKDKQNMERARKGTDQSVVQSSSQSSEPVVDVRPGTSFQANRESSSSHLQLVPSQTSTFSAVPDVPSSGSLVQPGSLTFKPFAKDERKQARYEKYLSLVKQGNKDAYDEVTEGHMTEWEREHEKEEFIKAAKMYKPLPGMIASRFTRAKFDDQDDTVDVPAEDGGNKDDRVKAAEMKMYGKLTRDVFEWHPDRLLCRRFNVQDPYPHSSIIGLPTVKKDKFSVFNFLTFPSTETSTENEPSTEIPESSRPSDSSRGIKDQRETAKSHDKPVSILSHLEKPNTEKSKSVSFSLTKPKSIFSHLVEDKRDKSSNRISSTPPEGGTKIKEEPIVEGEKKQEEEKAPVDLFAAIFGNTDSEDSEEEDEKEKSPISSNKDDTLAMDVERTTQKEPQQLPGGPVVIETIEQRLSPSVPSDSYGPLPPTASGSSVTSKPSLISSSDYLAQRTDDLHQFVDPSLIPDRSKHSEDRDHRKQKHSKHKHKKEKKSKHKKSKHKKKEKKKKKRYSDSDESENSSSDEDNVPTNRELLEKLKSVSKGKYLI